MIDFLINIAQWLIIIINVILIGFNLLVILNGSQDPSGSGMVLMFSMPLAIITGVVSVLIYVVLGLIK